jgi:2-keto-4-pentenoate hydratase/2-oxohepta-3-ene-1,7-dioic acid hydratase in catechol pathway
VLNQ